MELKTLEGKRIRLTDTDGKIYEGVVGDYICAEGNSPEEVESIIMDYPVRNDGYKYENPVEFTRPEIQSIEIL